MRRVATVTNVFAMPRREKGAAGGPHAGGQTPGPANHEQVVFCQDNHSGLRAIIGICSTALGPALGGTRFYPYVSEDEALADVLRLSTAMAYKNALAGLDHGGGKAVIIGDPAQIKTEPLLRAYGRFIASLGGVGFLTAFRRGLRVLSFALLLAIAATTGAGGCSGRKWTLTLGDIVCPSLLQPDGRVAIGQRFVTTNFLHREAGL